MPMAVEKRQRGVVLVREAVVAVINKKRKKKKLNSTLQALTTAAMVLPGIISTSHAADAEVTIQYGHYEEGKRDVYGPVLTPSNNFAPGQLLASNETKKLPNKFKPIEVDSIHAQAKIGFFDRWKFTANYSEDTWSGATPISTAPAGFGGNKAYTDSNDTVIGASPNLESLAVGAFFDTDFNPLKFDGLYTNNFFGVDSLYSKDTQLVHTLAIASPETRKQGDFNLSYEWDKASVNVGGGISIENDYESRFVNWGGSLDFNSKLTTLNFNQGYTNSTVSALLDHDAFVYLETYGYEDDITTTIPKVAVGAHNTLKGEREDWSTSLGLTQVLSRSTLLETSVGYTRSTGFMENPYKSVYVFYVDPNQAQATPGVLVGSTQSYIEQRPDERNQWTYDLRLVQHIAPLDAAVNVNYRFFHDDWGISAHTMEVDWIQPLGRGWTVTPTVRYYSQDAADFYTPYLVSKHALTNNAEQDYKNIPEQDFSSDHRLSGYGALSGGVVISKQFAKGVSLEMGFEYYTHEGALKLGGDGEGDYADFTSYSANAALKVDLSSVGRGIAYSDHAHHHTNHGAPAPAGVMSSHMLENAGEWMIGYNYMYSRQAGDMLQGNNKVSDSAILASNCGGSQCYVAPDEMIMHMHMFNIMYAPTDWLNLMIMPTFVDMSMGMRSLGGAPSPGSPGTSSITDYAQVVHANHEHMTGGLGDTNISALFKLYGDGMHHLHLGVGVSAPTGDVKIELRRTHTEELGLTHYGMQLGSGTWDLTPSLTYTGHKDKWSWGAQARGIIRLESRNSVGYALGDMLQTTAWGSYKLMNWLSFSVRGVYTTQGSLRGEYNKNHRPIGPMDSPGSYGGEYFDLGFGINATVPTGDLAGNSLSFEWLQPMEDDVNGYQLERDGALSVKWGYAF